MNITTKAGSHARITEMEDIYFSDFHKDVYGYRPRGGEYNSWVEMSIESFNDALDAMMTKMKNDDALRIETEADNLIEFKAELADLMATKRIGWKEAIKDWMLSDGETDVGFWLWEKGISHSKTAEIKTNFYG